MDCKLQHNKVQIENRKCFQKFETCLSVALFKSFLPQDETFNFRSVYIRVKKRYSQTNLEKISYKTVVNERSWTKEINESIKLIVFRLRNENVRQDNQHQYFSKFQLSSYFKIRKTRKPI